MYKTQDVIVSYSPFNQITIKTIIIWPYLSIINVNVETKY